MNNVDHNPNGLADQMIDIDRDDVDENAAESSKAGLRRMRRLVARPAKLSTCSTAAIHPLTSQLLFPAPQRAPVKGHLCTPLFAPSRPTLLPCPPALSAGKQLSISPTGIWTIIYHPNIASEGVDAGGTIAIYHSTSLLSPSSSTATVIPFSTYQLSSQPLATTHLFAPRIHTATSRAAPLGPRPSTNDDETNGPTFLVLTKTGLLLFHPQLTSSSVNIGFPIIDASGSLIPAPAQPATWGINVLQSPLYTRWYVAAGQPSTPLPAQRREVGRGWMGLVPNNEGVWIALESSGEVSVTKAQVGRDKLGRLYLQVTPIPTLPKIPVSPVLDDGRTQSTLQGIYFVHIPEPTEGVRTNGHADSITHHGEKSSSAAVERVGVALIKQDTVAADTSNVAAIRTRIVVHALERREVELAEGFSHITSGSGELSRTWDWSVLPDPVSVSTSPLSTSIIASHPIPSIQDRSIALVLLSNPTGLLLAHLDLSANEWTITAPVDVGNLREELNVQLIPSQAVARGQKGLVGLIGQRSGATLVVVPRLEGQSTLGENIDSASKVDTSAANAATAIILAERQGVDWSDVVRAAVGSSPRTQRRELLSAIFRRTFALAVEEIGINELNLLLRLQVAFFSATDHPALHLGTDMLRLNEATLLFDQSATFEEDGLISFDLDSIWPLIGVFEWAVGIVAQAMRDTILLGAHMDWDSDEAAITNDPTFVILLVHPTFRILVIRLLSQLAQLTSFLDKLDRPILQPESRYLPPPLRRDPMATLVARDRIRDIGYSLGVDIKEWGQALERLVPPLMDERAIQDSLLDLDIVPLQPVIKQILSSLPSSSTLFMVQKDMEIKYDAINFLPLPQLPDADEEKTTLANQGAKCTRCHWNTLVLPSLQALDGGPQRAIGGSMSPWDKWRRQWKAGCMCGGSWVKA